MKVFIKRLLCFIIFFYGICLILDVFISARLKKSFVYAHGEWPVWNDIYNGKINADIVINGSSRAWMHFDPTIIGSEFNSTCYNLGIDGQNFDLQYFRHLQLLRFNKKPKLVIQSLDDFTFSPKTELYNYDQFLPYMFLNKEIYQETKKYQVFTIEDFLFPGLRYTGKKDIIDLALKKEPKKYNGRQKRVNGFNGQDLPWNTDFNEARLKLHHDSAKMDLNLLKTFEKYLEECRQNRIAVILVFSPEFIEGQNYVVNHSAIIDHFREIAIKNNILFFDFSKNYLSYGKQYFYNAMHLNINGSKLFTKMLVDSMKMKSHIYSILK